MATSTKKKAPAPAPHVDPRESWTPGDYLKAYHDRCHRIVLRWQLMIEERTEALQKLGMLQCEYIGAVAETFRWGHGLEDDLIARYADEALSALAKDGAHISVPYIIAFQLRVIQEKQHGNYWRGGSSSALHNAVTEADAEVARRYADKLCYWIAELAELRAMAEVL